MLGRRERAWCWDLGQTLSFPSTDSRWTHRLKPGLDYFAFVSNLDDMRQEVQNYLEPLLDFGKETLQEKQEYWQEYPIYLKATAGLRKLPAEYRLQLIQVVRDLFEDHDFNPFSFEQEQLLSLFRLFICRQCLGLPAHVPVVYIFDVIRSTHFYLCQCTCYKWQRRSYLWMDSG